MADRRTRRVAEAQAVLTAFGLPAEQRNERAALTLLALLALSPQRSWAVASDPLRGVTPIMEFVAKHYGKEWAPNTRETVRRFTLHQFEQAGLVIANPDQPGRPTNSPKYCYQVESRALAAIRKFGTLEWENALRRYLTDARTPARRYAQMRDMQRIPLDIASGVTISLLAGRMLFRYHPFTKLPRQLTLCARKPARNETTYWSCMLYRYWLWTSLILLHLGMLGKAQAACGEGIAETRQVLIAEEAAFRATEQVVRAARAMMLRREADLREVLATPPSVYPEELARRLSALHRTEVALKLQMLDRLRARHEEARQQWERGHQLLHMQITEARTAAQSDLLSQDEYCRVQERYVQALQLYQQGMQYYRTGMELYAKALDAYGVRFLIPYAQGFTAPQIWQALLEELEREDFLHDFLVPLTANAVRMRPPDVPP